MTTIAILVSFASTLILLALFMRNDALLQISDIPNERSLHEKPIPRFGGLAIMFGVPIGWAVALVPSNWALLFAVMLLVSVSFLDDAKGMSIRLRFLAHFVAAALFIYSNIYPELNPIICFFLVVAIIWMTNLYNFMDGSDGLAGGMAFFGFATYGIAAQIVGASDFANMSFCIASAALGFLFYNFHPAKVFMGDGGSVPLGFLAGAMGLSGWVKDYWPFWFPIMVFSPFIVDATVTIFKRMIRGKKISQPHREHYYQRLVQLGWGHRKTALLEYALMLTVGTIAIWSFQQETKIQMIALGVVSALYCVLIYVISYQWRSHPARHAA